MNPQDPAHHCSPSKKGGWITLPFILGATAGLGLTFGGLFSNLEVYLIQEFNTKRVTAAKIFNVVAGAIFVFPVAAAVLADSFLGCHSVIWISSLISSLGMLLLSLTAAFSKLRPQPCENGSSDLCRGPTQVQLTLLYLSLALSSSGMAGTRFTVGAMGAHQFDDPKHQRSFFNWYIFVMYLCGAISSTAIVYVQDSVSWAWGFGIPFAANTLGLALFLAGTRFYRRLAPTGSPFAGLARVLIAAIRKRNILLSQNPGDYCHDHHENTTPSLPTKFFRFLNRAALKTEGETELNGTVRKSWKLCTVTEVEGFKSLIKMFPLWSSEFLVAIPLSIQASMGVLQALTMDRHLGNNFKIPAGTISIFIWISTSIVIPFIDRLLFPAWNKFASQPITPLLQIGIGHLLNVLNMAVSALVEAKRLKIARLSNLQHQDNAVVPISVFWLVPSLVLAGMGEAFHFPGYIAFYYQEFPNNLKSTSTALASLTIGIAFYVGNALIAVVRRSTDWLPDNLNSGRLDNVYWLVTVLGGLNFVYFLIFASVYKYKNARNVFAIEE